MPALLVDAERDTFQQQAHGVTQARMLCELVEALEALSDAGTASPRPGGRVP